MHHLLIWKSRPTCGYITHGGTSTFKWSICVNSDANFRICFRFKHFENILFPSWYFMQSIFRQFYYCIEITFIIFERDLYLNFNLVLKYSGQNWFAGNKDVKVPKKSTKFSYSQFWFRWNNATFFIKFLFFLIW